MQLACEMRIPVQALLKNSTASSGICICICICIWVSICTLNLHFAAGLAYYATTIPQCHLFMSWHSSSCHRMRIWGSTDMRFVPLNNTRRNIPNNRPFSEICILGLRATTTVRLPIFTPILSFRENWHQRKAEQK